MTISVIDSDIGVLPSGQSGCTYDLGIDLGALRESSDKTFTVFWGDGSQETFRHNRRITEIEHNYVTDVPNYYQIVVTGLIPGSCISGPSGSRDPQIVSIDTPLFGPINDSTAGDLFHRGSKSRLTSIPENIFDVYRQPYNGKGYLDGANAFMYSQLYGLFAYSKLTEIPETLFDGVNLIDIDSVSNMFSDCYQINTIGDVFSNPGFATVTQCGGVFNFTTRLTEISGDIFRRMPLIRSFYGCFAYSGIKSIPNRIFRYTENATAFDECFKACKIKSIPDDLFDNVTDSEELSFRGCFAYCTEINTDVPDLWNRFPSANGRGCFYNCTKAPNYWDIPMEWRDYYA